jgi:hypothetical protein
MGFTRLVTLESRIESRIELVRRSLQPVAGARPLQLIGNEKHSSRETTSASTTRTIGMENSSKFPELTDRPCDLRRSYIPHGVGVVHFQANGSTYVVQIHT